MEHFSRQMLARIELAVSVFIGEVTNCQWAEVIEHPEIGNAVFVGIEFMRIAIDPFLILFQPGISSSLDQVGDRPPTRGDAFREIHGISDFLSP